MLTIRKGFVIIHTMKHKLFPVLTLVCWLVGMNTMASASQLTDISQKLPKEIKGWSKSAEDHFYTPQNLFEYIDGGSELYISYDFIRLLAQKYTNAEQDEITVDIFDMSDSFNAFGVFSHSRETIDSSIAPDVESEYASGLLTFWKGKYYISILAYPETEEKKSIVLSLGRLICDSIDEPSPKPPLITQIPTDNLVKTSIRYFHHYVWLNSHFFISTDNILKIEKDTEAVLAKYKEGNPGYFFLLVSYPDPTRASAAHQSFIKHYLPDAAGGIKKLEDNRWTGCTVRENRLYVVFNAPTAEKVNTLLKPILTPKTNER